MSEVFTASNGYTVSVPCSYYALTVGGTVSFTDEEAQALREYFDAHPEIKPWHSAEEHEVWLVRFHQRPQLQPAVVADPGDGRYVFKSSGWVDLQLDHEAITHAERIWPKGEADDAA